MYGIDIGLSCLVNLRVTKRDLIMEYHSGSLVSHFVLLKIVSARVGYL